MGLSYNENKKQWEWEGDVRGLVNAVGNGDARLGFVVDKKSGAKISMNISDVDEDNPELGPPTYEPFYIESPSGEMMYDAYDRKEAVKLLSNIRKGMQYPDMDTASLYPRRVSKKPVKRKATRSSSQGTSIRGIRG